LSEKGLRMTDGRRGLLKAVGLYLSAAALLLAASWMLMTAVLANLQIASDMQPSEPTRLQEMVETAREIRGALAAPIARPQPLTPIVAKSERSPNSVPVAAVRRAERRPLPREAANSYARQPAQQFSAGPAQEIYDRHAVR
jgi:hypothetical protein